MALLGERPGWGSRWERRGGRTHRAAELRRHPRGPGLPAGSRRRGRTGGRLALMEFAEAIRSPTADRQARGGQPGQRTAPARRSGRARAGERAGGPGVAPAEISELEPSVRGLRALHIPESGVIDYRQVSAAYAGVVAKAGGQVLTGHGVRGLARKGTAGWPRPPRGPAGPDRGGLCRAPGRPCRRDDRPGRP